MNIIPHNEPFDLNSFTNELKAQRGGLDNRDIIEFFDDDSILHAFTGSARKGNRISSALGDALLTHEGTDAIIKATSVAIIVHYSPNANKVSELQCIPKLMELVPYNGELI